MNTMKRKALICHACGRPIKRKRLVPRIPVVVRAPMDPERNNQICAAFKGESTIIDLSDRFHITRQRITQILHRNGLRREHGGQAIKSFLKWRDRAAATEARNDRLSHSKFVKWGLNLEEYRRHIAMYGGPGHDSSPMKKYYTQRKNALARGIEWRIGFKEWWDMWQQSGKWTLRGRGSGYCMARWGDTGPYHPDNVYICSSSENIKDGFISKPRRPRAAAQARWEKPEPVV